MLISLLYYFAVMPNVVTVHTTYNISCKNTKQSICYMIFIYFNYAEHNMPRIYIYLKTVSQIYMNAEESHPLSHNCGRDEIIKFSHICTHMIIYLGKDMIIYLDKG